MCDGPAKTFTITVNPTAEVDQPPSEVVCNGDSTTTVTLQLSLQEEPQPIPGPMIHKQ